MFGVVPKQLWSKTNPPDSLNLCTWAMRSLLVEHGDRLVLMDCGIGNKQSEKFFSHYHLHGDHSLDKSLRNAGFSKEDITDVLLTHLHFDHVGGAVERRPDGACSASSTLLVQRGPLEGFIPTPREALPPETSSHCASVTQMIQRHQRLTKNDD